LKAFFLVNHIILDLKNSTGIVENTLEYNGINSLTFAWNTHESVQVSVCCPLHYFIISK